jgi:hypothetical protein
VRVVAYPSGSCFLKRSPNGERLVHTLEILLGCAGLLAAKLVPLLPERPEMFRVQEIFVHVASRRTASPAQVPHPRTPYLSPSARLGP